MQYRAYRHKTVNQVAILRNGERLTSHVLDISDGGVKLGICLKAQPGEIVRLFAKGAVVEAEIRWISPKQVGLRFIAAGNNMEKRRFLARLLPEKRLGPRIFGFKEL